jgi:ATP-binding cassette subfamily E protein 1
VERSGTQLYFYDPNNPKQPPNLVEELCNGCGICVKKCPFNAIHIINTPEALDKDLVHRYSENGFALFRLPILQKGVVTGLIGQNGAGKSTALKILTGEVKPNFGKFGEESPDWDYVIDYFKGTENQTFFQKLSQKELTTVLKPQYIDRIPKIAKGTVHEILSKYNNEEKMLELQESLNMKNFWDRDVSKLSGGEVQKLAIAIALIRNADNYLFDEPSSFLDISERLRMTRAIRELKENHNKTVVVVDHDLAVLDYLSDYICVFYGEPSDYGIVTYPHSVKDGINIFLEGYIREENMRFRKDTIKIDKTSIRERQDFKRVLLTWENMGKEYDTFKLDIRGGELHQGQVIGILGPNGIGKTTFVKILAGIEKPDTGVSPSMKELKFAYKPQYLTAQESITVEQYVKSSNPAITTSSYFKSEVIKPFSLEQIFDQELTEISGGELQKTIIAGTLGQEADLFLFDEPSAYLSVEDRLTCAKTIRRIIQGNKKSAFIVEHDIVFQDYVSDALMVFLGESGRYGKAYPPVDLETGMNRFLSNLEVTFRRDSLSGRPRVNKPNSKLDKEQRSSGNYYYSKTD